MAQQRIVISKGFVGKQEKFWMAIEDQMERQYDFLVSVAGEITRLQTEFPQVDYHIKTDVPHDIVWKAGEAPIRRRRLSDDNLEDLRAYLFRL